MGACRALLTCAAVPVCQCHAHRSADFFRFFVLRPKKFVKRNFVGPHQGGGGAIGVSPFPLSGSTDNMHHCALNI